MKVPNDPVMLFSYINTQLRDYYSSLDECCLALDLNREELETRLKEAGWSYDPTANRFNG